MDSVLLRVGYGIGQTTVKIMVLLIIAMTLLFTGCDVENSGSQTDSMPFEENPIRKVLLAAVGDSLTAGLGVEESQAYPAQLERKLLENGYDVRIINAGVSGETSSGALSRIEWVISSLNPDIVILETGANDGLRGIDPDILETNLDQILSQLTKSNIKVILAGMLMLPNLGPEYTKAFATIYTQIAEKHQIPLIPFFLDGVAGEVELNQPDRLHPNAQGYIRVVETVYPYVKEMLENYF